jgi:hypothetical protein
MTAIASTTAQALEPVTQRFIDARFGIVKVLELPHGSLLRWHLIQRSPYNPPPL